MFVMGLLFSVQIKDMTALVPAFIGATLIFAGAYIEFQELPYQNYAHASPGIVGLMYFIWSLYFAKKMRRRPDKTGRFWFLLFTSGIGFLGCAAVFFLEWPLDGSSLGL